MAKPLAATVDDEFNDLQDRTTPYGQLDAKHQNHGCNYTYDKK